TLCLNSWPTSETAPQQQERQRHETSVNPHPLTTIDISDAQKRRQISNVTQQAPNRAVGVHVHPHWRCSAFASGSFRIAATSQLHRPAATATAGGKSRRALRRT